MAKRLNALEVLFMHYVHVKSEDKITQADYWLQRYSTNPTHLIDSLLKKGAIYKTKELGVVLNTLKVPELKEILRGNNLKLSGRKSELIERIIANQKDINFDTSHYPGTYIVSDEFEKFYENTDFINYFHNHHIADIYDAYDYYLKHPDKTSNEIIIEVLNYELKKALKSEEYHEAATIYQSLAQYYYDCSDVYSAQYHLHNYVMLIILNEIKRYREYSAEGIYLDVQDNPYMFFINDWTILQYKSLLKTRQISTNDLKNELVESTKNLSFTLADKEAAANYIVERISDNFDASKNLLNKVINNKQKKKRTTSKSSDNRSSLTEISVEYNLDHKKDAAKNQAESAKSGCLVFFSLPTALIIYTILQLSNLI